MLWLALRFPSLPLEIFTRGGALTGPLAAAASSTAHAEIVACNPRAHRLGIHEGIAVAAAQALSADLWVFARDSAAEYSALERMASWALQFTPTVSIAPPAEVLLEVEGSLRLFGGFNRLWTEVTQKLSAMRYTVVIAAAPTPLAAQWFARSGNTGFSTAPHLHFGVYRTGRDRTTESLAVRFQTLRGVRYLNP